MGAFPLRIRSLVAVATVASLGIAAAPARADDRPRSARRRSIAGALPKGQALEHLRLGNNHLDLKDFDLAIAEYKKGALLEALPVFFVNLGIAHREAGRYQQAIDAFRLYLDKIVGDPLEPQIRGKIEPLIESMQNALTQPPRRPAPFPPEPGPAEPPITVAVDGTTAHPPQPQPPAPADNVEAWYDDPWGWGTLGTGVTLAIAAGVSFSLATSKESQANDESSVAVQRHLRSQADTRWWLGGGFAVAGGLLVSTGAVLLALPPRSRRDTATSFQLSPGPGDAGIAFSLSF